MPKQGDTWSPERRKAYDEMMERKRQQDEAAQLAKESETPPETASPEAAQSVLPPPPDVEPTPPGKPSPAAGEPARDPEPTISVSEYRDLLRQIEELKRGPISQFNQLTSQPQPGGPQVNNRGQLIGTFEKYLVDPKNYPDPCERLSREPRLARFAFPINYELSFETTTTQYQTQDGINTREPKFSLKLIKIVMDEETGEPTPGRYEIRTLVLHEDPQAALTVAREQNLPVDEANQKAFLDEMRYLRMRDWLVEAFYPPRVTAKTRKKDMVINNRVVQYYEVSSEDSAGIDFKDLHGKVK